MSTDLPNSGESSDLREVPLRPRTVPPPAAHPFTDMTWQCLTGATRPQCCRRGDLATKASASHTVSNGDPIPFPADRAALCSRVIAPAWPCVPPTFAMSASRSVVRPLPAAVPPTRAHRAPLVHRGRPRRPWNSRRAAATGAAQLARRLWRR